MKFIKKGKEPSSFTTHRQQENADYDNIPSQCKDELKSSLLKEQKYICCYCMQSINIGNMKIEHWKPQSKYPELQLDYQNLLAACLGQSGDLQHCDTHKANTEITINPLFLNCESLIKFDKYGIISSDNSDIERDLSKILQLNHDVLKKNRKTVLDVALKPLIEKHKLKWTKEVLQKEIEKWESVNDEKHKAYCQIVIFHLKKKLKQAG